jgi:hypothetical protein
MHSKPLRKILFNDKKNTEKLRALASIYALSFYWWIFIDVWQ